MKKLRVTIEGKAYDVLVEVLDPHAADGVASVAAPAIAPAMSLASSPIAVEATPAPASVAPKPSGPAEANTVVSPLAGKIVSIDVKVGQPVVEGGQVATIEAMKMNTYIYAAKAGMVQEVLVHTADAVEEGAELVRLA